MHIHFFRNIFVHQDSAFHVYAHICACPDKAVQMYFSRVMPKPVEGIIEFLQIVQTVIRQVICAVCIFWLLRVSLRRGLITTTISAIKIVWP